MDTNADYNGSMNIMQRALGVLSKVGGTLTIPELSVIAGRSKVITRESHMLKRWEQSIDHIIPLVGGIVDRLKAGIDVLDIGCGRGHAINIMARAYPNSRFAGYDLSREGIEAGRKEAELWQLTNVRFEIRDVTNISEPEKYGLITAFDTIHDQAQPANVLKAIHNSLQSNVGVFLMQDIAASSNVEENIGSPLGPALYAFSTMHCMTVSLAYDGQGLGTVWGKQKAEQMLKEAGFSRTIEIKEVPGDILNYYYVARK